MVLHRNAAYSAVVEFAAAQGSQRQAEPPDGAVGYTIGFFAILMMQSEPADGEAADLWTLNGLGSTVTLVLFGMKIRQVPP